MTAMQYCWQYSEKILYKRVLYSSFLMVTHNAILKLYSAEERILIGILKLYSKFMKYEIQRDQLLLSIE